MIASAIHVFGQFGFIRASTREIATHAGLTTPVLQYHFGNKVGLYTACIDLLTTAIWQRLKPVVSEIMLMLEVGANTPALIAAYCNLQDVLIDSFVTENEGQEIDRLMALDENVVETLEARLLMRQRIDRPVYAALAGVVGRILARAPDELQTGLHTFAMAGMFLVFQLDRERISKLLQWRPAEGENADQLKAVLRLQATTQLSQLAKLNGTWHKAKMVAKRPQRTNLKREAHQ